MGKTTTTRKVLSWWWLSVVFLYLGTGQSTESLMYAWVWGCFSLFYVILWWLYVETVDWK